MRGKAAKPKIGSGRSKQAPAPRKSRSRTAPRPSPPYELGDLLDTLRATVLALLATLQTKERTLYRQAERRPTAGVAAGLADIRVLRRWADETLRTIQILERGQPGELAHLVEELGEFQRIVQAQHPAASPED